MSTDTKVSNIIVPPSEGAAAQIIEASKSQSNLLVLFFFAEFYPPCKQMDQVVNEVSKEYPQVTFLKLDAENFPDITEAYPVESVPTFVFLKRGAKVDVLEGADPTKFAAVLSKHGRAAEPSALPASSASASSLPASAAAAPAGVTPFFSTVQDNAAAPLQERLNQLVRARPVMLFMKGRPDAPRCGFSRKIVDLLGKHRVEYGFFDILTDDTVRQGLKDLNNWQTYPQLYIEGELVGGLDVVNELAESGELQTMLPKAAVRESLQDRLRKLTNMDKVVIFMKGSPSSPRCGFSSRAADILTQHGFKFSHFDILSDEDVRNGLKEFSQWQFYPQIYIRGELVGGLDILNEMAQDGSLDKLKQDLEAEDSKAVAPSA